MGSTNNTKTENGDEDISPITRLIQQKKDETTALRNLLKALEEDVNKTNVKPNIPSNEETNYKL